MHLLESIVPERDMYLAVARENLAVCYSEIGRLEESRRLFERELEVIAGIDPTGLLEAKCRQNFAPP